MIESPPLRELHTLELDNVDIDLEELIAVLENCPVLEVLTVRDCLGMHEEDDQALRDFLGMHEEDDQVLRAKFARIKTLTFECYEDGFDWYGPEFMG
jgi:hypothetical protein